MEIKAHLQINNLSFELAAADAREMFQTIAQFQDIFEAEDKCGMCNSESIRYGFRVTQEGHKYYELQCRDCGAQFKFGQRKQTNELFPKRKDDDGKPLPHGGWSKWEPRDTNDSRRDASSAPPKTPSAPGPASPSGSAIPQFKDWNEASKSEAFRNAKPIRVAG